LSVTPRLHQSKSGVVRQYLAEILARMALGVPRAGVIEEFKQRGTALWRARRSARQSGGTQAVSALTPAVSPSTLGVSGTDPAATSAPPGQSPDRSVPPLLRSSKFESWDPRAIDEVLRNPPNLEALRKSAQARKRLERAALVNAKKPP
jgi:hypothetical protein